MARAIPLYPPDHALALARVLRVIDIVVARPEITDEEVVAQLVEEGVDPVDARLLVLFVPTALAYPTLQRMGVTSFQLIYLVRTERGRVWNVPLEQEHYFTAAMVWTEQLLALEPAARPLTLDAYWAVAARSAAMNAFLKFQEQHGPEAVRGSVVGPLVIGGLTAEQIAASRPTPARPWWKFWG